METDRIKSIFDDFIQQNLSLFSNVSEFTEYCNGVAESIVPVVKSFNLNLSDEEFSYFCAFFHKIDEIDGIGESVFYGPGGLIAKAFPENCSNYEVIYHDVALNRKKAEQPQITDRRTGTFVHLLRDAIFLYNAKIENNRILSESAKTITDTLSPEVARKITYNFPVLAEDVVTEADAFAQKINAFQSVVFIKSKDIVEDNDYFTNLCNSATISDSKTNAVISGLKETVSGFLAQRENITAYHTPETVKRFSFPLAIKLTGIAFLLLAVVGMFFMCKSMVSLSKEPAWQALKETGRAKSLFGNPFEMVFGDSTGTFSTDFDSNVSNSFIGVWALCETGKPVTAMNSLIERLQKYPGDSEAALLLIDLCMRYGYYDYFNSIFNTYLADREADSNDVARVNRYCERLDSMDMTIEEIERVFLEDPYDSSKEDISVYRARIVKQLSELLKNKEYDTEVLCEYLLMLSETLEDCRKYSEKENEAAPYVAYPLVRLAIVYRTYGYQAEAVETIEKAYKFNTENSDVLRAYATIEMVGGKPDKALELAEQAYTYDPEGDYIAETYLIALCENGRRGDASVILEQLKSQGRVFEDDFLSYWNGALSILDYYIEKEEN